MEILEFEYPKKKRAYNYLRAMTWSKNAKWRTQALMEKHVIQHIF